jgi:hypothetical protein
MIKSIKTTVCFTFVSVCKCTDNVRDIKDGGSGMSLPGATVLVREQQMGNVRLDGKYSIELQSENAFRNFHLWVI